MDTERCDWSGCRKPATGALLRPLRHRNAWPRPSWTAVRLFFCDEHGEWMRKDCPNRRWHRLRASEYTATDGEDA